MVMDQSGLAPPVVDLRSPRPRPPAPREPVVPRAAAGPAGPAARAWPGVSVIMPVLNEEKHLADAVTWVLAQGYEGEWELILALGPSTDRTDDIARSLAAGDDRIRLVVNPGGRTPAGLNFALRVASYDVVVRVDGHGLLSPDYIRRAVLTLQRTGAANVGGLMVAVGETPFEDAVAFAYGSRAGLGGGAFHVGAPEGPAESVYLGVFRREVLNRLGGFDEHYQRAQDWELNLRIRRSGEVVWFDPELAVTYRPRSTLGALVRQFSGTGRWRREVVRRYPGTASVRYLAPPAAVLVVVVGLLASLSPVLGAPLWLLAGAAAPVSYAMALVAITVLRAGYLSAPARLWLPVVLATIHASWGVGFLLGAPRRADRRG